MIRVVKLGGSLLSLPSLLPALDGWLQRQPPAHNALVIGGGVWVDALRDVQRGLGFDDRAAHRLALEAMSLTARMISAASFETLASGYPVVDRTGQVGTSAVVILDILPLMQEHACELPESWSVTSDSLAAWSAKVLGAAELVLLKSRPPARPDDGLVDDYFATAAAGLPAVRLIDFRKELSDAPSGLSGRGSPNPTPFRGTLS